MYSIFFSCIIALLAVSCRTNPDSSLKDALLVHDGRMILLKGSGGGAISIKECATKGESPESIQNNFGQQQADPINTYKQIENSKDCPRLPGTIVRNFTAGVLTQKLYESAGIKDIINNTHWSTAISFLKKFDIPTQTMTDEYKRAMKESVTKLEDFRKVVSALGDDPYLPSQRDLQMELEKINALPGLAQSNLQSNLRGQINNLTRSLSQTMNRISSNGAWLTINKHGTDANSKFAFFLFSSLVNVKEVPLEFVQVTRPSDFKVGTDGKAAQIKFKMGETKDGQDYGPQHEALIVRAFDIMKTEVTQSQWFAVMGSNPSFHKGAKYCKDYDAKRDICPNLPVESVSWDAVQVFITRLNQKDQVKLANERKRYALPTENEWEFAARGGKQAQEEGKPSYVSEGEKLDFHAWTQINSTQKTLTDLAPRPVALLNDNPLGLFDIYGNVWEWTANEYAKDYSEKIAEEAKGNVLPQAPQPADNIQPQNGAPVQSYTTLTALDKGLVYSVRGGGFFMAPEYANSVTRRPLNQKESDRYTGFRLIKIPATNSVTMPGGAPTNNNNNFNNSGNPEKV